MSNKGFILSPSSLNLYLKDPALFVLKHFYGIRGTSNIYAIRGKLVEDYVNMCLTAGRDTISFDEFVKECKEKSTSNKVLNMEDIEKPYLIIDGIAITKKDLEVFYKWGQFCKKRLGGIALISMQKQVLSFMEGIQLGGYLDYECHLNTIDLKTTSKLPIIVSRGERKGMISKTKADNIRQQVVYRQATNKEADLLYCTPTESLLYRITQRDTEETLPSIIKGIKEIKNLLEVGKEEAVRITPLGKMNCPFRWSESMKQSAIKIWGNNEE